MALSALSILVSMLCELLSVVKCYCFYFICYRYQRLNNCGADKIRGFVGYFSYHRIATFTFNQTYDCLLVAKTNYCIALPMPYPNSCIDMRRLFGY